MALMTRVSRLLRADVHALLDRLEEPDVLLQQAVRDMEEVIVEQRHRIEVARRELDVLRRRREELTRRDDDLSHQLDAAIEMENKEVARSVMRRHLECQALGSALEQRSDVLHEDIEAQQSLLAAREAELESLRQQADAFGDRGKEDIGDIGRPSGTGGITDDEVEAALLAQIARRSAS